MFVNFAIISKMEKNREMLLQSLTWKPKLYIFNIISMENSTMKNMFVISGGKKKGSSRYKTYHWRRRGGFIIKGK